jgi:all-trans-retinol dehydrogenase (NAD+)
MDLNENLVSK